MPTKYKISEGSDSAGERVYFRSLDLSFALEPSKACASKHTTPKTRRKPVPLADIDAIFEKHHHQECPVSAQSKAGKQPSSRSVLQCKKCL